LDPPATINSDILQDIVEAAQIGKTGDAFIINRNNALQTKPRFAAKSWARHQDRIFPKLLLL